LKIDLAQLTRSSFTSLPALFLMEPDTSTRMPIRDDIVPVSAWKETLNEVSDRKFLKAFSLQNYKYVLLMAYK